MELHNAWQTYTAERDRWASDPHWATYAETYDTYGGDEARARQRLAACERLLATWVSADDVANLSPDVLERLLTEQRLRAQLDDTTTRLDVLYEQISPDAPYTADALQDQDQRRAHVRHLTQRRLALESRLAQLPLPTPPTPTESLDTLRTYADELTWVPRYLKDDALYTDAQTAYHTAQTAHQTATTLLDTLKTLEHRVLTSYLDTFNATLEAILTDLFDDPITVTLRLFHGDKPDARWLLAYKGAQDRALSELSGGEQDRVSLAVTLALASTAPFPALLLDECFGALDALSRERCLDTLRRTLPHKPVLIIAHGETEGDYDTTLTL